EDAELFARVYGLNLPQEFEHGYVLRIVKPVEEVAQQLGLSVTEAETRLSSMRSKLLEQRQKRDPLLRDDKVLASWNGLMIRAYANAAAVFGRDDYARAAEKAAVFLLRNLR